MLKPTNTAGAAVGGAPIAESPWVSFVDAAGPTILESFGWILSNVINNGHARRHSRGASTSAHYEDLYYPQTATPQGALIGLDGRTYWCQPNVWGIRIADPAEITTWKDRVARSANAPPENWPTVLKDRIVVELRTHAWRQDAEERQALYAMDERTEKIVFLVGDEPIYDTEPIKEYKLSQDRRRYEWGERPREPIYIDGKRQKIIGSRFEARYDPEGWLPRWFRFAT